MISKACLAGTVTEKIRSCVEFCSTSNRAYFWTWLCLHSAAICIFSTAALAQETMLDRQVVIGANQLSQAFRQAAKSLRPSVVTISAISERSAVRRGDPFGGFPRDLIPEELLD